MPALQSSTWETNLFFSLAGAPALGLLPADLVVKYKRSGDTSFQPKTLLSTDLVELGNGFYAIKWSQLETSNLGMVLFTISSVKLDNFKYDQFDVVAVPLSTATIPQNICVLTGSIVDIGGAPGKGQMITARLVDFPGGASGAVIASDPIRTVPDVNGNFQLPLVQGKTVILEIDRTAVKVQIVVPFQSTASLLGLLPPLPN